MGRTLAYVAFAVALVLFGAAGLFSVGAPFLLTGIAMLVCFPWRRRRRILWPSIAGVWGFTLGYVLVAPLGCTTTSSPHFADVIGAPSTTICSGVLFDYSGRGSYRAPLLPAVVAGTFAAVASAMLVWFLLSRPTRAHRSEASASPPG